MTQQSHSQAYALRKPKLKKTHVPQCSLQHYLQQLEHGSNLLEGIHQQFPSIHGSCPSTTEWIKKVVVHIHNGILLSHKRNAFESVLMRWMKIEPIIQSEKVKVTQLCPTLCDPMDCSPPGSSIHGIFQARVLEWVAISFSKWNITQP